MRMFGGRQRFLMDAVEDGGGGGLSKIKDPMQNLVDAIIAKANPTTQPPKTDPKTDPTGLYKNVIAADPNKKTGVITNAAGGGNKVTYIGNGGSKQTGTTLPKVTPGQTPSHYAELADLYKTMYNQQIAANNAAMAEAKAQAEKNTEAQIAALAEQYAGTNRQLYRDMMEQRRTLPQQLAAMGYNGGLTESSMLRMNNNYEEGLNENERARLAQETSYNQALAQQLYDLQSKTTEANQAALQNWYGQQAALKDAVYQDLQNRAATMAASGDFSEYKKLGFSDSEIAYLKAIWAKMNPTLSGSGSSGSSGGRRRTTTKTPAKKTPAKKTPTKTPAKTPTKTPAAPLYSGALGGALTGALSPLTTVKKTGGSAAH